MSSHHIPHTHNGIINPCSTNRPAPLPFKSTNYLQAFPIDRQDGVTNLKVPTGISHFVFFKPSDEDWYSQLRPTLQVRYNHQEQRLLMELYTCIICICKCMCIHVYVHVYMC